MRSPSEYAETGKNKASKRNMGHLKGSAPKLTMMEGPRRGGEKYKWSVKECKGKSVSRKRA